VKNKTPFFTWRFKVSKILHYCFQVSSITLGCILPKGNVLMVEEFQVPFNQNEFRNSTTVKMLLPNQSTHIRQKKKYGFHKRTSKMLLHNQQQPTTNFISIYIYYVSPQAYLFSYLNRSERFPSPYYLIFSIEFSVL